MHIKYLLGSIVRTGYRILVSDFYLVLHGLRCRKKHYNGLNLTAYTNKLKRYVLDAGRVTIHTKNSANAHRTLHDATRQDNPRQENRVMCGGLRHDATRQDKNRAFLQISSIVRSLTTRPDFCLVVSRRVADPRTLHDFL